MTVPVIIRARSEARNTAAFAVSETLAGTFRKLKLAILAIICSFEMSLAPTNEVHRLLDRTAVGIGRGAKADSSDAGRADFHR